MSDVEPDDPIVAMRKVVQAVHLSPAAPWWDIEEDRVSVGPEIGDDAGACGEEDGIPATPAMQRVIAQRT